MNVNSVASVSAKQLHWRYMKEFVLERGHMNVNIVASVLAEPVALENTKKSTLKQGGVHVTWTDVRLNVYFVSAIAEEVTEQARNQDFMWGGGGANEAKADPTTEMYFLSSDPFI